MRGGRLLALALVTAWCAGALLPSLALPARAAAGVPIVGEARSLTAAQARPGHGWAAWEVETSTDVEIAFSRQVAGSWSHPKAVQARPGSWDRSPSLAVASGGVPWLAWVSTDRLAPDISRLYVTRWTGLRWAVPETVPMGDSLSAAEPALAAGPDGTLWLAWAGFDGVDDEIFASSRTDQGWSTPQRVGSDDQDAALYDCQPQLAVGQDGQPWLVWTGHQAGVDDEIYASRWSEAGWSTEQMVSLDDEALDVEPTLALDGQGQPWVAWKGRITAGASSHRRILLSRWEAGSAAWTHEEVVSSPLAWQVDERHAVLAPTQEGAIDLFWEVDGHAGSALALAHLGTSEPVELLLVRSAAPGEAVTWSVTMAGAPVLVWLDPAQGQQATVQSLPLRDGAPLLSSWDGRETSLPPESVDPIWNRYMGFGDSITRGEYGGFTPYPALLEAKLDSKVQPSESINVGINGERTYAGRNRIAGEVATYLPEYVLIMEGTNDVTGDLPPADVKENLELMVDFVKHQSGVGHVKVMIATLIPRLDGLNNRTNTMNQQAVIPAAAVSGVPLCDQWTAFKAYPDWGRFYSDEKHPNQEGLQLLADTFYECLLTSYEWLHEDTTPPVAMLGPISSPVECAAAIPVSWSGSDPQPGTGLASFDVQAQVDAGGWTDWLLETALTEAIYPDLQNGHVYSFRVRARDVAGNVGEYSVPVSVQVQDTHPPESVSVYELPAAQQAPFAVYWSGTDACSGPVVFDVEYRAGAQGNWLPWLSDTPGTSALFDPADPQYGESYSFRARARDQVGLWSDWSPPVSTLLAQLTLRGDVLTVRHEPVIWAEVTVAGSLAVQHLAPSGFAAYLSAPGDYDLEAGREGFGVLPPMHLASVITDIVGLELVLPPVEDAVQNGGFEAGGWGNWQPGGTLSPTLGAEPHTGHVAVLMGGGEGGSTLSQSFLISPALTDATLSLVAWAEEEAGERNELDISLEGPNLPPITATLAFAREGWVHAWVPVDAAVGKEVTLTFSVSGAPSVRLDEVSLGSARSGGGLLYLPLALRNAGR